MYLLSLRIVLVRFIEKKYIQIVENSRSEHKTSRSADQVWRSLIESIVWRCVILINSEAAWWNDHKRSLDFLVGDSSSSTTNDICDLKMIVKTKTINVCWTYQNQNNEQSQNSSNNCGDNNRNIWKIVEYLWFRR